MQKAAEPMIFFEEKHSTNIEDVNREGDCPLSIPYLKKGDSNIYLEQFLVKEEDIPELVTPKLEEVKDESSSSRRCDQSYHVSETVPFNPSAFHNFQKHLTVCLKHALNIPREDKALHEYRTVALKMWKTFKNSTVSNKKILHFLLGERNEHPITEEGLKEYGLHKITETHAPETMREARVYLASEVLSQIKEGKLQTYISAKKLKDKQKFRRYVGIFVQQLENGYLRKRLAKDDVAYLRRI